MNHYNTRSAMLRENYESLEDDTNFIAKYVPDAKREDIIKILRSAAKEYCEMDKNFEKRKEALRQTENEILEDESLKTESDVSIVFKRNLEQSECNVIPDNVSWGNLWKIFDECVQIVPSSSTANDSMNSSIVCSQTPFQIPLDPLSKRPMKNPCKNTKCGHVYELDSIMMLLDSKKKQIKCPYIGCVNVNVLKDDLVLDAHLKNQISLSQTRDTTCSFNIDD